MSDERQGLANGTATNGLATVERSAGGIGGGVDIEALRDIRRSTMAAMTRAVKAGNKLDYEQMEKNVAFAVELRDNPKSTDRDRIRATEFLDSLIARGINVAMYLDGRARPQVAAQVNVGIQVVIRPAGAA